MAVMRTKPEAEFKSRVKAIKPKLMKIKGYRKLVVSRYPEYNTFDGATLIGNVVTGQSSDAKLTQILEEIVREWEAAQEPKQEEAV